MSNQQNMHKKIILALDVPNLACAESLADELKNNIGVLKIGFELFISSGRDAIRLGEKNGLDVFLDLKIHDIPETVERSVRQAMDLGVKFITVHVQQKETMERIARLTENSNTNLLVVTVLTSMTDQDIRWLGGNSRVNDQVEFLASQAYGCGIRGFVCSPIEVSRLRTVCPGSCLVVPGIRPYGSSLGDQKRTGTPGKAMKDGASYIVVGRPIRDADDRVAAARAITEEMTGS